MLDVRLAIVAGSTSWIRTIPVATYVDFVCRNLTVDSIYVILNWLYWNLDCQVAV